MPSIALINDWSVDTQLDIAYLMEYIKAITSFRTKRFKIYVTMNMIGVPRSEERRVGKECVG